MTFLYGKNIKELTKKELRKELIRLYDLQYNQISSNKEELIDELTKSCIMCKYNKHTGGGCTKFKIIKPLDFDFNSLFYCNKYKKK